MFPYLLLLFLPLLFCFVAYIPVSRGKSTKRVLAIGWEKEILNNSLMLPAFFILFFLLLVLRDESIGRDLNNYHVYFDYFGSAPLDAVLEEKSDILYWLLNWAIGQFTDDYQIFLMIVSGIILIPIAKIYCEDREYGFLKITIFVNMSTFIMIFSGLRQAIAMSIGLIAYEFVRKKKFLAFLIFFFLAWGFHHTAFILFLLYPLYHINFHKKHLLLIVPAILFVFIFNEQVFMFATKLLANLFGERYDAEIEINDAVTMLVLFVLLAIFSYVLPNEKEMDKETLGLRNFLLMAVLLQCFAPVHTLAMRMNYYFIIFIPILVPKILKNTPHRFGDVAWLAKIVMNGFFLLYYLYTTYIACQTGVSALDTYPYKFFWGT